MKYVYLVVRLGGWEYRGTTYYATRGEPIAVHTTRLVAISNGRGAKYVRTREVAGKKFIKSLDKL